MDYCKPDIVIAEKVERNMDEFMTTPPIMQGPEVAMTDPVKKSSDLGATLTLEDSSDDTKYYLVSGEVSGKELGSDMKIYIRVGSGESAIVYEAFTTVTDTSDYGYQLYLNKQQMQENGMVELTKAELSVIVEQNGKWMQVSGK